MFEQTINSFITSRHLLSKEGKYIIALSGGPDSVALLRTLVSLGYTTEAAHCNFHLRGEESNRDEAFCKSLCEELGIPFHVVHFDTEAYAQLHKVSIEMAARNLRYRWFAQLCKDIEAAGICVAHHQDDQVETVLLNMLRGTGLKGLTGMKAKSFLGSNQETKSFMGSNQETKSFMGSNQETCIIRPFLCVNEAQILEYLKSIDQTYVIDSTNLEDDVQRNKLRLDIIPLLEKITPAASRNIIRMTENLQDISAIIDDSLNKAAAPLSASSNVTVYDIKRLCDYPSPKTLLWHILSPLGFNRSQVTEASACIDKTEYNEKEINKVKQKEKDKDGQKQKEKDKDGQKQRERNKDRQKKEWQSHSHIAMLDHELLYIVDRQWWEQPLPTIKIPEPGLYSYESGHIRVSMQPVTDEFNIPKEKSRIAVDAAKVSFPLTLRPAKEGDRLQPFGMRGSKLISDYLKDRHRSIIERHRQLVLTDRTDTIFWLVGECISDNCKVIPPSKLQKEGKLNGTTDESTDKKGSKPTATVLIITVAAPHL